MSSWANMLNRFSSSFFNYLKNNSVRAMGYACVQGALVEIYFYTATLYYEIDTASDHQSPARSYSFLLSVAALGALGAYAAIPIGQHIKEQEELAEKNQKLSLIATNKIAKWYPRIFAFQVAAVSGIQACYYIFQPTLKNDLITKRILISIGGLLAGLVGAAFQTGTKLARAESKLILYKKNPNDPLNCPSAIAKKSWHRYLRGTKYLVFLTPAQKVANMLTLSVLETLSTPADYARLETFGLYANIAGISAGLLNLAAILTIPSYLGQANRNTMNFLLYSMYIYLGVGNFIAAAALLAGNEQMANDMYLDGWLYLAIVMGILFSPSLSYDSARMNNLYSKEIRQHRSEKLKKNQYDIEEHEVFIERSASTSTQAESWSSWLLRKTSDCFSFFKKEKPKSSIEPKEPAELQHLTNNSRS